VGAMGARAKETPSLISSAVAGATLSSLATVLQLVMLLAAIHRPTLQALIWPLAFGGVSIAIYGLVITLHSLHKNAAEINKPSKTFSVKTALLFAAIIAVALVVSSALKAWFGQAGLVVASAAAGVADVHAAAISVASLAAASKVSPDSAIIPILVAFSVNAISKAVMAFASGGKDFSRQVILGLIVQISATWAGWWLL
jgi:uncharacterized membrane protein (DUF4010 family)